MDTIKIIKTAISDKLRKNDWKLLIPYLLLTGIGILMVYSSSSYFAMTEFSNSEHFFIRQMIYSVLGLFFAGFVSIIGNHLLQSKRLISLILIALLGSLVYLLFFVDAVNGSNAWLDFGFIGIQPLEFVKLAFILYLGIFLSNSEKKLAEVGNIFQESEDSSFKNKLKEILNQVWTIMKKPTLFLSLFLILILIQPDLGGTIILAAIALTMFLLSGIPFKIGITFLGAVGVLYSFLLVVMKWLGNIPFMPSYMVERFTAFLDPFGDVQKSSFQLVNSFYALARGGLFGVGIGESVQKSGYLPESYTDFIVPIMGEELGLLRVLLILSIFFYLVYHIYKVSLKISDSFGQLVCVGIATLFLVQGTINVGGAVGLMPLTGVTFPFISYGGSSMLVSSICIGIVNNIYIHDKRMKEKTELR